MPKSEAGKQVKISLVVAMDRANAIGIENRLPWHLPADLKRFKEITRGHPVVMGRRTFESILSILGKPLPGRKNIVVTRQSDLAFPDGVISAASLNKAISSAKAEAVEKNLQEVMVIGGEQIYSQALPLADRLYVTVVDTEVKGDAFFPAIDGSRWVLNKSEKIASDDNNRYDMTFCVYQSNAETDAI